ncbi:MAG: phosphoglycerate kinase [Gammaproteobacteria bacterium]|nr:phosphoglycerate kinase [Gammaproteobacteria bacterium]
MKFLGLNDFQFKDQKVLLRLDLNAPVEEGKVTNDERLIRSLPTISHILEEEGKLIIISHLGRPEENDLYQPKFSLSPIVKRLEELLGKSIPLIEGLDNVPSIESGELLVLENIRFLKGEKSNEPELSKKLANLADIFVMDAFATSHRAHSSTAGIIEFSKNACAGLLLREEVNALSKLMLKESTSSLAVLGGAKISTKLNLINSLSEKMGAVILGGGLANTCLAAQGYFVGNSLIEESMLGQALELSKKNNVIIPEKVIVANSSNEEGIVTHVDKVKKGQSIFDVAPDSFVELRGLFENATTILWNGPMGLFEEPQFSSGTKKVAEMIASSKAFSVCGGGDTISAAADAGVLDRLDYVSTAGGAFLEFVEGRKLPALEALQLKALK